MNSNSQKIEIPRSGFYVYTLLDDDTPFYVGKGTGYRIYAHEKEAQCACDCSKCQRIRSIWATGGTVKLAIVFKSENEAEVLQYERDLIAQLGRGSLCNRSDGGEPGSRPEYISVKTLRSRLRAEFRQRVLPTLSERDRVLFWRARMHEWVEARVLQSLSETKRYEREKQRRQESIQRAYEIAEYEGIDVRRIMPGLPRKYRKKKQ